jgi:hypothetical protein
MSDDSEFTARLVEAREREAEHRRQEAERRRKFNLPDPPDAAALREKQRRARAADKKAVREAKEATKREKAALKLEQQRLKSAVRAFIAQCREAGIRPRRFVIGTFAVGGPDRTGPPGPAHRRGWRYRRSPPNDWWISTRGKMHMGNRGRGYQPGGDKLEAGDAASLRALVDQHIADMATFIAENEGRPRDWFR